MNIYVNEVTHSVRKVVETSTHIAGIPTWVALKIKDTCDCCSFPFDRTAEHCYAVKTATNKVVVIHADCLERMQVPQQIT